MLIREMSESDISQVSSIEQKIFSEPWTKDDFTNAIRCKSNGYLVVEINNEIVAYCGYWGIAGEGDIYNVAVKQEYRGQQIGYHMLTELIQHGISKGIASYTLEVRASNTAAIRLYERLGFQNAGIRKDFYTKPREDAVIMWLEPIQ
ncbi:MAG: hypothetical protein K0S76_2016 [Herbinix sp.]|jgi:ribosomal-protein-alanine N-acetyltransferase|nr:hypothetical protein [Herbinix sp.]